MSNRINSIVTTMGIDIGKNVLPRTACSSLTRARQDFFARSTVAVDRFSRAISTS